MEGHVSLGATCPEINDVPGAKKNLSKRNRTVAQYMVPCDSDINMFESDSPPSLCNCPFGTKSDTRPTRLRPWLRLSGSGLSPESLTQPHTLTSVRQYITVCHNALQLSKDPETPFRVGSRIPLSAYGMYGFALVCSPTIREYF
jgi:hypothetical protein